MERLRQRGPWRRAGGDGLCREDPGKTQGRCGRVTPRRRCNVDERGRCGRSSSMTREHEADAGKMRVVRAAEARHEDWREYERVDTTVGTFVG